MDDAAPPMHLLAGLVRNAREAQALVALDVNAIQRQTTLDHLLACCSHQHELERLHDALLASPPDPKLNAAVALVSVVLAGVHADIDTLLSKADAELWTMSKTLRSEIDWFRSANASLVDELQGCGPVAAAKERLWLIEESLLLRIDNVLALVEGHPRTGG